MYHSSMFLDTVSGFARTLLTEYDRDEVLNELNDRVTAVLGLHGSGVSLAREGGLEYVCAVHPDIADLERTQEETQRGPCTSAYEDGKVVTVADLRLTAVPWPEYREQALKLGIRAVAGIPMLVGDRAVGALNLYSTDPRDWSEDDLAAAGVLTDMATSYIVFASRLAQREELNQQLQGALESRVIIEQAKGVIARDKRTDPERAFDHLRRHARNHNTSVRSVAEAVVRAGLQL